MKWVVALCVVAVVLVAALLLLLPPVQQARIHTRTMWSGNNLKNLGLAAHNDAETFPGVLPGYSMRDDGTPLHGWTTFLLPFIDQTPLYDRVNFAILWDDPEQAAVFDESFSLIVNPSMTEREANTIDYAGNVRLLKPVEVGGVRESFPQREPIDAPRDGMSANCPDGAGQTIAFGEIVYNRPAWGRPGNLRDPAMPLGTKRGFGGVMDSPRDSLVSAQFTFADATVRELSGRVDPAVLKALATPDGGDDPGEGW